MVHNLLSEWTQIQAHILELEQQGVVTRTFRRLDAERQQAIVVAILDEAIEKGPASINIKTIAGRAGVAVGSLYQYFNNRDGLLEFTTRICVSLLTDAFDQFRPMLSALPLRQALYHYLTGGVAWSQTMTGLMQFFCRAAYQGDPLLAEKVVRPVATAMLETVREILSSARERGELRPDLDIEAAARVVNAWAISLGDSQILPYLNTYFQVSDEKIPFERVLDTVLVLLESGLCQPDGGA
jgi:AcrR family transcriptional regulator